MVDFLVFNELSLPFNDKYKAKNEFKNFFEILNNLRKRIFRKSEWIEVLKSMKL